MFFSDILAYASIRITQNMLYKYNSVIWVFLIETPNNNYLTVDNFRVRFNVYYGWMSKL